MAQEFCHYICSWMIYLHSSLRSTARSSRSVWKEIWTECTWNLGHDPSSVQEDSSGKRYRPMITKTSCFCKPFLTSYSSEAAVKPWMFQSQCSAAVKFADYTLSLLILYLFSILSTWPLSIFSHSLLFRKICPFWCNTRFSYPPLTILMSWHYYYVLACSTPQSDTMLTLHLNTKTSVSCLSSVYSQYFKQLNQHQFFAILSVICKSKRYFQIAYLALTFLISLCFWSCFLVLICLPGNLTFACFFFYQDSAC